ncbi:MAG: spermidine/putrescine ABC transporter substrate-binding protein [Clostridia bacterium]|nr:spermidine/putrescine ABC transporter substrate-binding protein [Clostridia bacterium]MBO5841838.1 spermidine/putrescine ABC transporter substrate-binding protein [Clostridia bacterium]
MRKTSILSLLIAIVLLLPCLSSLSACDSGYDVVLNVYNWGEYISDGSFESLDVNKAFEQWYFQEYGIKVKVNYDTYDSNESLRAKLEAGSASYDVIIPSDYMIDYFIEHDMLLELNYDNIPNFEKNIPEQFRNLFYDPENKYTVPYTYGMVGIVYDTNVVDEEDIGSWDLMWNPDYAKQILQFDNSRDAFGTAMYKLGLSVNSTNTADWDKAFEALAEQKPVLKRYVMDQVFNMMESGDAAIAAYYAGDCITMMENASSNVSLDFFYPRDEQGNICTNLFMDAMCIPTCAKNKDIAEAYINFMLSTDLIIDGEPCDVARANAEYIYYATPNAAVYENPEYQESMGMGDEECDYYAMLYPEGFDFAASYERFAYANLNPKLLAYISDLWLDLKLQ